MIYPMLRAICLSLCLLPQSLAAADYAFCWVGGGGYTIKGRMTIDDSALSKPLVTEADVTAFYIEGFHDNRFIGAWNLRQSDGATFHLRFDPAASAFPMGGATRDDYQAWNADGTATNCGNPGFGFNAGNNAQDICLNGEWITDSMIDRWTPLTATAGTTVPPCGTEPQLSLLLPIRD